MRKLIGAGAIALLLCGIGYFSLRRYADERAKQYVATHPDPDRKNAEEWKRAQFQSSDVAQLQADPAPPEIVRVEEIQVEDGTRLLTVGNTQGRYVLACHNRQESCVNPIPNKDYFLFTKSTHWRMPQAKKCCLTLATLQEFSVTYNNEENIALYPVEGSTGTFGIYWLRSWRK